MQSVPVPEFVLNELSVQCKGKAPNDLVFGTVGICNVRSHLTDRSGVL
jgi:hypothetical protein